MTGRWLVPWHPDPYSCPVLLCLPPAGAGCGQFRSWQAALGLEVSVIGVQLPGREERWTDPPPKSMADLVRVVVTELSGAAPRRTRVLVYGHSFGGLLGYEITRGLGAQGRWPIALVVGACRPPHRWIGAGRGLIEDDDELPRLLDARRLDELDRDTRELMLDVLRQDARLSMTYTNPDPARVDCAVQAWGGDLDQTVTASDLDGWRDYTTGPFRRRQFAGGHYFGTEQPESVLFALRELLVSASTTVTSTTETSIRGKAQA